MVLAAGCATRGAGPYAGGGGPGGYHRVARGETLWSISRQYGVKLSELTQANGISNASQIEVGQRLRIPGRTLSVAEVPVPVSSPMPPPVSAPRWEPPVGGSREFVWPVDGRVISIFGTRGRGRVNKGVDIQAASGSDVRAARGGRVDFVHEGLPGFGKTIIIDHGEGFASVYAYVSEILVGKGDVVSQRQVIARVGDTGRTDVPALHFEIRRNQKPENPLRYLP